MRQFTVFFIAVCLCGVQAMGRSVKNNGKGDQEPWIRRLLIEGTFRGQNLVVQNPFDDDKGYCVMAVAVNGVELQGFGDLSEFEIDMESFGLKPGDKVEILIEHRSACGPIILNPGVLK